SNTTGLRGRHPVARAVTRPGAVQVVRMNESCVNDVVPRMKRKLRPSRQSGWWTRIDRLQTSDCLRCAQRSYALSGRQRSTCEHPSGILVPPRASLIENEQRVDADECRLHLKLQRCAGVNVEARVACSGELCQRSS